MNKISTLSILLPIVLGILTFKRLDRGMRFVFSLVLISLINELVTYARVISVEHQYVAFHLFTIIEVEMILLVLYTWFKSNVYLIIMAVFSLAFVANFFIYPITEINTYIQSFGSLCILMGLGIVTIDFVTSKFNEVGRSVVVASFAIYFSVMLFLYSIFNHVGIDIMREVWTLIHTPLNILLSLGIAYGFYSQYYSNRLRSDFFGR